MSASDVKWVRLGNYIEECDERNNSLKYDIDDVRGISILKKLIDTKADMTGVSLSPYKVMNPNEFCYVTVTSRNGGKISLAMNEDDKSYIVSSSYITFRCKDENVLYPRYLYLLLSRSEFDRYSRFNSWGSARETFDWEEMCRVQIPLPDITIQKELVAAYNGLKRLAEENEALIEPLQNACQAYVVDCKAKYPMVKLGEYIEEIDERNSELKIKLSQGISNLKYFQEPKQVAENSKSDKIVRKGYFAYNRATTRNGEKISIAYRDGETCTVSSAYGVFKIIDEKILNPFYLMLFFKRSEFDRYARWRSEGSAHEFFTFEMMQNVEVPLPSIEVQNAIVELYHCLDEAKKISSQAREQLKTLCPALVQRASKA